MFIFYEASERAYIYVCANIVRVPYGPDVRTVEQQRTQKQIKM